MKAFLVILVLKGECSSVVQGRRRNNLFLKFSPYFKVQEHKESQYCLYCFIPAEWTIFCWEILNFVSGNLLNRCWTLAEPLLRSFQDFDLILFLCKTKIGSYRMIVGMRRKLGSVCFGILKRMILKCLFRLPFFMALKNSQEFEWKSSVWENSLRRYSANFLPNYII